MPKISESDLATVIVSFIVEPENQQSLIDAAKKNSEEVMKKKDGFVSASIHRSLDGKQVINYGQWKSRTLYDMAINFLTPDEVKIGEKIFEYGEADWHIYNIVEIIGEQNMNIAKDNDVRTVINILSVNPENQNDLIEIWSKFLNDIAKNQPGFIGSSIHKSFDGQRVVSYSQWKSDEDFQKVFSNIAAKSYLDKQKEISESNANFYQIVFTSD